MVNITSKSVKELKSWNILHHHHNMQNMQIKPTNIVKGVTPRWKYLSDLWSNVNLYFRLTSNQKTIWKENHKQFIRLQLCRTVFPLATTLHSFCNQITFCYIQTECDLPRERLGNLALHNFMNFFTCKYRIRAETFP